MTSVFLYFCFWAQLSSAEPTLSPEAMQHLEAGAAAEKAQKFELAIAEFRKATELENTAAPAYVRLGSAYMENHQYGEAIPALERAVQLNPDSIVAHQSLGLAQLALGYAADAIPHLEKAQELGALGIAEIQVGQISEAVSNLQAAIKNTPNDPDLLYYLSQASGMLAQESSDALLERYPGSDRAHEKRGQTYVALHQLPQAEKEYRLALADRPDLPGLHLELGQVYAEGSQWSKAEAEYRVETKLQPGNAEAAFRLGYTLLQESKFQEALAELQCSDELRPDMSETLYSLGKAASVTGDAKVAERAWLRVVAIESQSPLAAQAHFALASLYRKQGKGDEARDQMREFHEIEQHNDQSLFPRQ